MIKIKATAIIDSTCIYNAYYILNCDIYLHKNVLHKTFSIKKVIKKGDTCVSRCRWISLWTRKKFLIV